MCYDRISDGYSCNISPACPNGSDNATMTDASESARQEVQQLKADVVELKAEIIAAANLYEPKQDISDQPNKNARSIEEEIVLLEDKDRKMQAAQG